ncbi:hypothetical protein H4R18_001559 [Coemansia javaensis]|uniref:Uncharacterized protein n=1 Tax=Coemansia javaensis TaxID=2761396 RepID=A0A9W8HJC9_9FUNG|nr:hypothetical protein H4R18_001559 [Coemansia javaensis]
MALGDITLRATNAPGARGAPQTRQATLFDVLGAAQRRHKRPRKAQGAGADQENAAPASGQPGPDHGAAKRVCTRRPLDAVAAVAACHQPPRALRRAVAPPPGGLYSMHAAVRARQRHVLAAGAVSTVGRLGSLVSPAASVFRLQDDLDPQAGVLPLACRYSNAVARGAGRLALVDEGGFVTVFDTLGAAGAVGVASASAGLRPALRWRAHDNAVFDIAWRMDNAQAATASADETCRLWDVERQLQLGAFVGHTQTVRSVSWRHGSEHCFSTASRDGSIMMWDTRCNKTAADGGYAYRPVNTVGRAHHSACSLPRPARGRRCAAGGSVTAIRHLQHNPSLVASTGSASEVVKYWDVRMRAAPRESALPAPVALSQLPTSSQRPRGTSSLVLDPDGTRLYSACKDNQVYVHNALLPGQPVAQLAAPEFECRSFNIGLAASPCSRFLAAGSTTGSVVVWELDQLGRNSSRRRAVLQGHAKEAGCVAWYPGRERVQLATCGDDGILRVWEENALLAEAGRADPAARCSWGFSSVLGPSPPPPA